jgi:hypothetical protein
MEFPITVCKEDADNVRSAEDHKVSYAFDSKDRTYVLLDVRGWWNNSKQEAHDFLDEPMKNEAEASAAMHAKVRSLKQKGWIETPQTDH